MTTTTTINLISTIVLFSIVFIWVINIENVLAKKDKDKDDDDDFDDKYDFNYKYKYKFGKDGSFKYKYKFNDGNSFDPTDESQYSSNNVYNRCYKDGQTDRTIGEYKDSFVVSLYPGKDLKKSCKTGYHDGFFADPNTPHTFTWE